ncbi:Polysaccharide chain length determinant protein, PEP-CTERM locus subfamily [Candidatus Nitrotoga sp. HW29]|uniref:XrtA system polysaccharide chain length determinant n=1 Tax=Candidatus Nitrotoga sp. HW29 TaxID=2886963 RepID=UPI001EF382B6|nr:XrtA system polysaccharide chain length determinant [Candidatus Nitrotoga sp. HW29]CAH1906390.1 Polysaccharide chain length determinant protein, PEP-CTERM locus subfamily [Candidatus Nitrotoga sp. HW29]
MEELIALLLSYLKGIWKYRWYAVVIAWIIVLAGGFKIYSLPNNYEASARVFVDTRTILKPLLAGMTTVPNMEQQVSIMSRTLLSRPNVERVMRMVDLDIKAIDAKDHERLVSNMMGQIKINGSNSADLYVISYNHQNPKIAKDVVQSFLTIFVEGSFGNQKQDSEKAIKFIDEQIKNYEDKLVTAEKAVTDFQIKNSGLLPRDGDYGSQLQTVTDSLNEAKLGLREAEQARNAIKNQIEDGAPPEDPTIAPAPSTIANPEIDARIQALTNDMDALRLRFTERHPDVISIKRLITKLEERKVEEAKLKKPATDRDRGKSYSPMLQQLNVSLSEAEARVAAMKARVEEYSSRSAQLKALTIAKPQVAEQFSQLNRDYQINKTNYESLIGRRESAKLSGELSATSDMLTFKVIDPPTVPLVPSGPNRLMLFSLVFVGALLGGIGSALLMSQIRPTFLSQNSLRESIGLPILGTVTMNWTANEVIKRKRSLYAFGLSISLLVALYSVVMVFLFLKL